MSIYYGPTCTCGAWMSVTPPPPCPVHMMNPVWAGRTVGRFFNGITRRCQGRHCAHGPECGTYVAINGGVNG